MTCDEIDELAGAIALGAVPDDEWAAIREHLTRCPRGGHPEIERLLAVAELLVLAAPPAEPSAGLRERILSAAAREAGTPAAITPIHVPERAPAAAPASAVRPRRDRWWWVAWGAAAALLVVGVGLAAWNVALHRDLAALQESLAANQRVLDLLIEGENVTRLAASRPGVGDGVLVRPPDSSPTLVLSGLPRPDSQVYQVWLLRGGQPTSLGVFLPDSAGRSMVPLNIDLGGADALAITLEPGPGGSPSPTSAPILVAPVQG